MASGLANAKSVLDGVKRGETHYDFIEFMACPGGCVNGGGQPMQPADGPHLHRPAGPARHGPVRARTRAWRIRKSHENPVVKDVYDEYLGEPGSHKAHELLHCTYVPQKRYRIDD